MIEEIKDISDLLIGSDSFKNFLNSLVVKINNFEREIKDIKEEYCKELNKKDEFLENQKKEIKVKINNFVEEFPKYIKKEDFHQEMENEDIVNKLIEKFKDIFTKKNDEIKTIKKNLEEANTEIEKRETIINNLEKEIEDLNKNYELKKEELNKKDKFLENQKKEIKVKINNFVEEFQEYKEDFYQEMKNEDIVNKLIEKFKDIFTKKNDEIKTIKKNLEEANTEIEKRETIINNLEKEIKDLSEEYRELKKSNIELKDDKKEKEKKLKKLMEKCEEFKDERDSMGDLLIARKLYNNYLEMDTRVKTKFEDILIQKDFESFVSSGYSISTIDNIWDIIKIEYKNISSEDLEKLKEIFKFFIIQINKRFKEEKYGLIEVNLGEEFDAVTQVDLNQNSRGKIVEFVFYGYGFLKDKDNSNNEDIIDKIIKNPLVLTK
ncbi:coiled-coil domain-containing protein [Fusobacterium polymorphum]|uniref:coiled-coil domain-containing protein n=1 Tax=Fusobacterium nucleatum subsp. polymorphum TaxID=76857 RepID=UPI00300A1128